MFDLPSLNDVLLYIETIIIGGLFVSLFAVYYRKNRRKINENHKR